jgi:DNA-binding transcriptional regulator GbsR (MarR family)
MTIEAKRAFVEEVAIAMEASGLPRMWGRVFGALLIADPPDQAADDLADTLQASKGSISTATRALEQMNLIERVSKTGIRKDFFRNKPGAWPELMQRRSEAVVVLKEIAERGLRVIESGDPEVRRGLEEMREYLEFFEEELPKFMQRWERRRAKSRG